jgi:hypothetical protein
MAKAQTNATKPAGGDETDKETQTAKAGPAITVTARAPRRRAGYRFGPSPVTIAVDDLSEAQKKALADDPELQIKVTENEE